MNIRVCSAQLLFYNLYLFLSLGLNAGDVISLSNFHTNYVRTFFVCLKKMKASQSKLLSCSNNTSPSRFWFLCIHFCNCFMIHLTGLQSNLSLHLACIYPDYLRAAFLVFMSYFNCRMTPRLCWETVIAQKLPRKFSDNEDLNSRSLTLATTQSLGFSVLLFSVLGCSCCFKGVSVLACLLLLLVVNPILHCLRCGISSDLNCRLLCWTRGNVISNWLLEGAKHVWNNIFCITGPPNNRYTQARKMRM